MSIHRVDQVKTSVDRHKGTMWVKVQVGNDFELTLFVRRDADEASVEPTLRRIVEGLSGAADQLWAEDRAREHDALQAVYNARTEAADMADETNVLPLTGSDPEIPF